MPLRPGFCDGKGVPGSRLRATDREIGSTRQRCEGDEDFDCAPVCLAFAMAAREEKG
jgi:hypothetical protein